MTNVCKNVKIGKELASPACLYLLVLCNSEHAQTVVLIYFRKVKMKVPANFKHLLELRSASEEII